MSGGSENCEQRGRWLAIDLGDRRVGLAISDPSGTIASPAGFLDRRPGKRPPLTALLAKATELEARGFVIGLPLDKLLGMARSVRARDTEIREPTMSGVRTSNSATRIPGIGPNPLNTDFRRA